jgi:hypothetical protein
VTDKQANDRIKELLDKADDLLAKSQRVTEQRLLQAYRQALEEVQNAIKDVFTSGPNPNITQLRKYNRLTSIEEQIAGRIRELTKVSVNVTSQANRASFLQSYNETEKALELGTGLSLSFDRINQESIKYAVEDTLWLDALKQNSSKLMSDVRRAFETTLRTNARQEVVAGLAEGKPYAKVAKAIKERFDVAATRARMIAFTEMHKAHSKGRMQGIEQGWKAGKKLGFETYKVWRHNPIGDPRPGHLEADGLTSDIKGVFTIKAQKGGTFKTEGPGLSQRPEEDIYCHCSAQFQVAGLEKVSASLVSDEYELTEKGLEKINPDRFDGQSKAIAEAILKLKDEGRPISGTNIIELAKDRLVSEKRSPHKIVQWKLAIWKKEGLLKVAGEGVTTPPIKVPIVVPPKVVTPPPVSTSDASKAAKLAAKKDKLKNLPEVFTPWDEKAQYRDVVREFEAQYNVKLNWSTQNQLQDAATKRQPKHIRIRGINRVAQEIHQMRKRFPQIDLALTMRKAKFELSLVDTGRDWINVVGRTTTGAETASGLYARYGQRIQLASGEFRLAREEMLHIGEGNFSTGRGVGATFRHELGHHLALGMRANIKMDMMLDDTRVSANQLFRRGSIRGNMSWTVTHDISRYANSDFDEAFAEAFAAYTDPTYGAAGKNRLPKEVEHWFDYVLHRTKKVRV